MRSFLPLCALLLVLLCLASLMDVTEGRFRAAGGGARSSNSSSGGSPGTLSGGTWAACVGSTLLAAAPMLL
ncbi:hypothetical protein CFC21_042514 [Triticum aestivum]|uniref:Uncharacterized protein n=3 Tax=Triticum TaxID=4564 RepID=A0A9R1FL48_WHEAT|nr:hypothetical protein CFC21_042514 [Triticum aestivum]CDM84549.1 unnamed protein product [Triticum aestivum]VAH80706.1 unnamed protein product [Triticum turgidum subsp. durum]